MSGSWASALAIITRRFIPPDNSRISDFRLSHSVRRRRISSTFLFALANVPMLLRHGLNKEEAEPVEPGPVE